MLVKKLQSCERASAPRSNPCHQTSQKSSRDGNCQQYVRAAGSRLVCLKQRKNWSSGTAVRTIGALELPRFLSSGTASIEILPMEWMEFLRSMELKGIIEQTSRVRGVIERFMISLASRKSDPTIHWRACISFANQACGKLRACITKLPPLLRAIRAYPSAPDIRIGLHLLSMLACRPSELREARWSDST